MISAQTALNRLIDCNELFYDEMVSLMRQIMSGEVPPELTAAILIGLRVKVESVSEITAAASVMREFADKVTVKNREHLVDIVGTGGDNFHTFNISTTSMFVAAAAGARVAKHGSKAVSSSSGSADVIDKLGIALDISSAQVGQCIDELGIGFMYAPNHHSAMRHVAGIRKALGVRTIFNILGPLTNPADAENQMIGVFHPDLVGILANVFKQLGSKHAMIVHGSDGLDEITLTGNTLVAELKEGAIIEYEINPKKYGFSLIETLKPLQIDTAEESKEILLDVLEGGKGIARDIVLLNAAATLQCAGLSDDFGQAVEMSVHAIDSGLAKQKMESLQVLSQKMKSEN